MKAAVMSRFGGPEVMEYRDIDVPKLGIGVPKN